MRLTSYRYSTVPRGVLERIYMRLEPCPQSRRSLGRGKSSRASLGHSSDFILTCLSIAVPTVTLLLLSNNAYVTKKYWRVFLTKPRHLCTIPRLNNTYVAIRVPYIHISHTRLPYQHFPRTMGPFCIFSVYPEVMNLNHTPPRRA